MAVIDHLVLAVADLSSGMDWFEEATGIRPVPGGSHDGKGTHNALVSMGACYLELLAPDPAQPAPDTARPFGIDDAIAGGETPCLVGFAVRPDVGETLDELADRLADAGHDPGPSHEMDRRTPDGGLLRWTLTFPSNRTVPFLVDWGTSPKPNETQPGGVELSDFSVAHPRPFDATARLAAIGLDVTVVTAESGEGLSATISGPDGDVVV